ncbi:D-amino-acid transaminase [Pacificimonas sp. WHA3]|uniref:D-amino-acid transaminase n=1 Tax=Pacificimonas pallii TaxID=2827236 RepID=A0ABS6SBY9_9SPHN|nr:D-amino-acid transaminase [Pacificimonas pallii]MBV7255603.1 D-amino-acid transaminase [Pacificimonas pallii]
MPRIAYTNGRIRPMPAASVSINDRAYLFGDGVYEVAAIYNRRLFDWQLNLDRLARSLEELRLGAPMSDAALTISARRLIAKSRVRDGLLYIQVTRGAAPRDHAFPERATPGLTMVAKPYDFAAKAALQKTGVAAVTVPDERWARRDIKSVALLANVLAKQAAKEAGAFEAIMIAPDGTVTEGSSTTLWMVARDGRLMTRPLTNDVLPGSRRRRLAALLSDEAVGFEEDVYSLDDARAARELFLTSTSGPVMPVTSLDGAPVGDGKPGPVAMKACALMWQEIERQTGWRT